VVRRRQIGGSGGENRGVPSEFKVMVEQQIIPRLKARFSPPEPPICLRLTEEHPAAVQLQGEAAGGADRIINQLGIGRDLRLFAVACGVELELQQAWLTQMEAWFASRGRVMAASNRKQAETLNSDGTPGVKNIQQRFNCRAKPQAVPTGLSISLNLK
jgi:hypothetical protein